MVEIKMAITNDDIALCWEAMSLLRPMLKEERFIHQVKTQQEEGYALVYILENDRAVSVAGYRFMTMLYSGKMLYIDDLSTLETCRGKGYASILLDHLFKMAKANNCRSVQLDSGPARTKAHKLYFKENFTINAFHFNKYVESGPA